MLVGCSNYAVVDRISRGEGRVHPGVCMQWNNTQGITVCDGALPFLHRGYKLSSGRIVWRMTDIHQLLRNSAGAFQPINKFVRGWVQRLQGVTHLVIGEDMVFHPKHEHSANDGSIAGHVFSTAAITALVAISIVANQTRMPVRDLCKQWLGNICHKATHVLAVQQRLLHVHSCNFVIVVNPAGVVHGFEYVVECMNPALFNVWLCTKRGLGPNPLTIVDVLLFLLNGQALSVAAKEPRIILQAVLHSLLEALATLLDEYVLDIYGQAHDLARNPNVLRGKRNKLVGGRMDPETAWSVLQRARNLHGASVGTIVAVKNDSADLHGVRSCNGLKWATKELALYVDLNKIAMSSVCKYMLAADPSTYQGQETLVGVIWAWEVNQACFGLIQVLPASSYVHPEEVDMSETLKQILVERKLERVKAYRELQGFSSMLYQSTGKSLDDFLIPAEVRWKPVSQNEVRIVDTSDPIKNKAVIYDKETGRSHEVLPENQLPGTWCQLTAALDSGSIGRAGMSFARNSVFLNLFCIFDKIHRLIRDLKLAAEGSEDASIYRAMLQMSFVFSLNQRPFGSGTWWETLQEILQHFLATETHTSPIFLKYVHLIAADFGMPSSTEEDHLAVFLKLADMASVCEKGAAPKMMRWFNINELWADRGQDFWALRMLLEFHHGGDGSEALDAAEDPGALMQSNPRKELRELRASHGGMKLAQKLLTPWLRTTMKLYYYGTKSSWTWYTEQVQHCKTPKQGIAYLLRWSRGEWRGEINSILTTSLENPANLVSCELDWSSPAQDKERHDERASTLQGFVGRLVANRAFSNLLYEGPPFSYVGVFSSKADVKREAMLAMRKDAELLFQIETIRHIVPCVQELLDEMLDIFCPAVRILYITFERDKWSSSSADGRRHLASMLKVIPDTKIVEDAHQHLRDLQRRSRTLVSSKVERHRACVNSGVLEAPRKVVGLAPKAYNNIPQHVCCASAALAR